jgi:putative phosphoribosyl transferase
MSDNPHGSPRVISRNMAPFENRIQAGRLLAAQILQFRGSNPVVLGIPRGGVVTARELAQVLDGDFDVVLSRKLGTPGQPELAMGSMAEDGTVFLNPNVVRSLGVSSREIEQEKMRQQAEMQRRTRLVRDVYPRLPLRDRVVIVTDDGVATGATMQAALWVARQENPQKLIAAIPVASEEAVNRLAADADETVCLHLPSHFYAVGQWYRDFPQVDDGEVLQILKEQSRKLGGAQPGSSML